MSKDNILLYRSHSIPSGKYSICRATLSSSARKYDHTLKRTYTDEDVSSNSTTSTTLHSLTTENLEIHAKRSSLYRCSKFERINAYIESITPELIQESDVYNLHEKELTDLLFYEQETEPLNKHISNCYLKESKKKKGWVGRLRHWIKFGKGPKKSIRNWSISTVHEKDQRNLDIVNALNKDISKEFVDSLESDKIIRRPSQYNPRIASVPIERQPKFSPNTTKRKCHVRTSKSSKQIEV